MIRSRNLGPTLALAAAAIALLAIIAGFLLIGGPGHARDRRLDEMTERKIGSLVSVVQCAFNATGLAPITYELAKATRTIGMVDPGYPMCGGPREANGFAVAEGDAPSAPGDISYSATGPTSAKVCGNFRIDNKGENPTYSWGYGEFYPQLDEERPSGVHCYELELVKTTDPAALPLEEPPPAPH